MIQELRIALDLFHFILARMLKCNRLQKMTTEIKKSIQKKFDVVGKIIKNKFVLFLISFPVGNKVSYKYL